MKVERPGKFYWETTSPAKQTIVTTGKTSGFMILIFNRQYVKVWMIKLPIPQRFYCQEYQSDYAILSHNAA